MIISKSYAEKLIRKNDAEIVTGVISGGKNFIAINNKKTHRTDHYEVSDAQFAAKEHLMNPDIHSNIKADIAEYNKI